MSRPLRIITAGAAADNLIEFSDAQLERLSYLLRVAFSDHLEARGTNSGRVYVGSGGTAIGSLTDHKSTARTATKQRNNSGGADYPAYPGLGTTDVETYNFRQHRGDHDAPTNTVRNADGYVQIYDTNHIRVAGTSAIISAVIDDAISEIRTGDEVGSYRIATSTPTNGGAGTWDNIQTWFEDTTYSEGTTTYNLYLKRSLDDVPGSAAKPLKLRSDYHLQEASIATDENLIQNVLLPLLLKKGITDDGSLRYVVGTSVPSGGVNRGSFSDTKQTTASNTQSFSNPTYSRTSTPSGNAVDDGTKVLYIQA